MYFERTAIELPAVDWAATEPTIVRDILSAIEELARPDRERVENDIDRVAELADEAGQVALYSVTQACAQLDTLRNANDRALWMFLNEPDAFRHAEEVRYTDDRRRGRMWDGFVCAPGLNVHRDERALHAFKRSARECFETENVHPDIFDRHRTAYDGTDFEIVQITVYSEDQATIFWSSTMMARLFAARDARYLRPY